MPRRPSASASLPPADVSPSLGVIAACLALLLLTVGCAATPPVPGPPPPPDEIILLPDDQGKTGAIIVTGAGGERLLSKPRQAVKVEAGAPPGEPFIMPEKDVRTLVGSALDALPRHPAQFILYFDNDTAVLCRESREQVRDVVRTVGERASRDVSVVGHTDTVGTRSYNNRLSLRRAQAVAALLTAEGVDPAIIEITFHGKDNPLVPTGDQVPEPRNRRVEVTVR